MSDFKKIPYVGEATEADLLALGYDSIASLKGADPDEMYERTKALGAATTGASSMLIAWFATTQILRTQTKPNLNGGSGRTKFSNLTSGESFKFEWFYAAIFFCGRAAGSKTQI